MRKSKRLSSRSFWTKKSRVASTRSRDVSSSTASACFLFSFCPAPHALRACSLMLTRSRHSPRLTAPPSKLAGTKPSTAGLPSSTRCTPSCSRNRPKSVPIVDSAQALVAAAVPEEGSAELVSRGLDRAAVGAVVHLVGKCSRRLEQRPRLRVRSPVSFPCRLLSVLSAPSPSAFSFVPSHLANVDIPRTSVIRLRSMWPLSSDEEEEEKSYGDGEGMFFSWDLRWRMVCSAQATKQFTTTTTTSEPSTSVGNVSSLLFEPTRRVRPLLAHAEGKGKGARKRSILSFLSALKRNDFGLTRP